MRLLEVFLLLELKDRLNYIAQNMQKKIFAKWQQGGMRTWPRAWQIALNDGTLTLPSEDKKSNSKQIEKVTKFVVEWFAQFDPTLNKKYTDWLIRQWIDGRLLLEDVSSAKRVLETFEEHKKTLKKLDLSDYDQDTAPESPNIPPPERRGDLNSWKDYRILSAVMRPLTGTQAAGEKVSNFLEKPVIQDYMNHPVPDPVKGFGRDGEFDLEELRDVYQDEETGRSNFDTMDWYNSFVNKPDEIATTAIKLIYKSDRLAVLQPNTEAAACELGKGTEWCTAYTDAENYYWTYAPDGPIYIILTDKMGKVQFHFESDQFQDVHNDELSKEDKEKLVSAYPELKEIFAEQALRRSHDWLIDPAVWTPEKIDGYMETYGNAKPFMPAIRQWEGKVPEETLQYLEKIALQSPASAWAYLRNPTAELYKNSIIANAESDDNESQWNVRQIVGNAGHVGIELDDEALGIAVDVTATALERIDPKRIKQNPELVFRALADSQYGADVFRSAAATVNSTTMRRESSMTPEHAKAIMDIVRDHPKGKEVVDKFAGFGEVVRYLDYFGTEPWLRAYKETDGRGDDSAVSAKQAMDYMAQTIDRYPMPKLDLNALLVFLIKNDLMHMETFKAIEKAMGGELPIEIQQAMVKKSPGFISFMENPHTRLSYEAHRDMEAGGRAYRAKQEKSWAAEKAAAKIHADAGGDAIDFEWDGKVAESITEGVSSILYHVSSIHNVRDILTDNSIRLTPNFGTQAERGHEPEGKIYYLSTARSKTGSYGYPVSKHQKQGAMIVFDGRALMSAGYTGKAMDYWGPEFRALGKDEMEDRIFSKKPAIPKASKYIKEIHILFAKDDDYRTPFVARVLKDLGYKAKRLNIPLYIYTDQDAYALLNKAKSLPVTSVASDADRLPLPDTDVEPRGYRGGPARNNFGGWIELLKTNDESKLSKDGKYALHRAGYMDTNLGVDADIHNARSDRGRAHLDKFLAVLQQFNIKSSTELMTYVNNKFRS